MRSPCSLDMRLQILLVCLAGSTASADPVEDLQKQMPGGWTVLATEHELVMRHDKPCFVTPTHENAPGSAAPNPCMGDDGQLVTIELRFHLEPKWSQKQLDAARGTNERVGAEVKVARDRYRVDAIHQSKGRPLPATPDERKRLSAFEKEEAQLRARAVKTPMCTLGDESVFDGDETYALLKMKIDPPSAGAEAFKALEALKKLCGAA